MKKSPAKKRLVLLDAHAVIHRAYHALPDFATSSGQPTGALYGLVSMVLKIATDLKPDYIIACYDLPKPTYRHEVYEGYKAGRAKTDDALSVQLEKSKEVCQSLSIPIYSLASFEADDILGTIVEQMQPLKASSGRMTKGKDIEIIIASGDMDTMQLVDETRVKVYTLKKGLNDTILYDEEAVRKRFGFGPELLPDFKGLRGDPSDNIIGIAGIGEKTATELIQNFGTIEEIYKKIRNPKSEIRKKIKQRVLKLLEEGEEEAKFSKMLATIRRDAPIDFKLPEREWKDTVVIEAAEQFFKELEFRAMGGRLREVLKLAPKEASVGVSSMNNEELEELKVALWVADSNITDPNIEDILQFAKTDSLEKAKEVIFTELEKRESRSVFEEIEKPLLPILREVTNWGVRIDTKYLSKLSKEYSAELKDIEKKIWKLSGMEFNIASPKQLGEILFDKLGIILKNQKKTSTGAKSTRESELEKMKEMHPIIPLVLEHRQISKLLGTYLEPIPKLVDENYRLHARFIQTGSTTGRMASENPNLQNIPIGSERGRKIRHAFVAAPGATFVALDYSQIELRIAAFLSHDQKLISIFKNNEDIHTSVASHVFHVPLQSVTKEMRRQAKVINFGILYGMGVSALKENLGTDRAAAQEFYNSYFAEFYELAEFIEQTKHLAYENGFTKTFFGRRRYFEGIKSKIPFIRAAAERMAVNAPIQGTQADLVKIAMRKIDDLLKSKKLSDSAHLIMQIHDELVYEVKNEIVADFIPEAKNIMEQILTTKETSGVPILANSSVGESWGDMQ